MTDKDMTEREVILKALREAGHGHDASGHGGGESR